MLPQAPAPAPAVVFLHGSGPHPRAGFRPYVEQFAELGLASLFFDKRGSGGSGGSWINASLDDLAIGEPGNYGIEEHVIRRLEVAQSSRVENAMGNSAGFVLVAGGALLLGFATGYAVH